MEIYAKEHFHDEENLLREHGYSGLDGHIKIHLKFAEAEKVQDYKDSVYAGYVLFQDMLDYLKEWLVGYFTGYDQLYMDYINSK